MISSPTVLQGAPEMSEPAFSVNTKASGHFTTAAPSDQNILDIFAGEWSSAVPGLVSVPGHATLFNDPRIAWMDELFQVRGSSVIELGPLEGAHSRMMSLMGARSITAIEANRRAFLKCLCIKEIFRLDNVRFLLGDFNRFFEDNGNRYDIAVAAGVLDHMEAPLNLLAILTERADRIFLWTHFYDQSIISKRDDSNLFSPSVAIFHNAMCYFGANKAYAQQAFEWDGFSGGPSYQATWLTLTSILDFFANAGFETKTNFEQRDHPNGPAIAICATRVRYPTK
jgi:hypothetical protein